MALDGEYIERQMNRLHVDDDTLLSVKFRATNENMGPDEDETESEQTHWLAINSVVFERIKQMLKETH
jgi:hypothetical protein